MADTQVMFVRADLGYLRFRELLLLCHSGGPPSDASWDAWVERSVVNDHRVVLVSARGSSPTPRQRRELAERRAKAGLGPETVALLTDATLLRGVLTAFAWITGNTVKAFSPNDLVGALTWLEMAEHTRDVHTAISELHASINRASQVA